MDIMTFEAMNPDPILSEIRRTREKYAEQFLGDIRAMLADLQRRQHVAALPFVGLQNDPSRIRANKFALHFGTRAR